MAQAETDDAGARLEAAHRALLERRDIQFDFPAAAPPQPPPQWLQKLADFLSGLFGNAAPALEILFWGLVVLAVLAVLYLIAREVGWLERVKKNTPGPAPAAYRPEAALAQALLADADALAAEGRFGEAIHTLLLRSIEDMRRRRPRVIEPAATSRDIAELEELPPEARPAFVTMAEVVEASLFGGRPVNAANFAVCRRAYEAFAFPQVWA